jgi:O-antigen ligase
MQHIKKFKLYYLLGIIFFLASFRGDPGSGEALTYRVPSYIAFVQKISIYVVISAMMLSLWLDSTKFKFQNYYNDAIFFYLFFIILILSGEKNGDEIFYRLIFSTVTFLYFLKVVSRLEPKYVVFFICIAAFVFSFVNFLSYFLFPETIWNGRLFGVTSHPNFTGVAACISAVFLLYFLMNVRWKFKILCLFMLCITISVCLFSGSRNSLISFILAFFVGLFIRTKGFAPKILLVGGALLLILFLLNVNFSMSSIDYEGRGNTREETWKIMMDAALDLPLLGNGKSGSSSNSYLFAIIASGMIGFFFLIASILAYINRLTLYKVRNNRYFTLFCMLSACLFFAALFEGFFLDQVSISVFTYWLLLVIRKDYNIQDEKRFFKLGY